MIFFVVSTFRDFVIKDLFHFPDKPGFTLCSNRFIRVGFLLGTPVWFHCVSDLHNSGACS